MLTTIIVAILAVAVFLLTFLFFEFGLAWSITCCILTLILLQLGLFFLLRARMKIISAELQGVMLATKHKLEMKQQQFYRQHNTNQKLMMQLLEKEQNIGLREAIAVCEKYEYLRKWNAMIAKQLDAARMGFYYQMKDWENVDKIMPKCLYVDAQSISMRLARMYVNKDANLDKFFKKKTRLLRGDNLVLPTLTYAWILLKQDRFDDAFKVLSEAKKKCSNEVLIKNWEALANKKPRQFSNAGLNELWYALALEEMKIPRMQQKYVYR